MRAAVAILALLLISLAAPAQAASFSCNAATTSIEKAICADQTLSRTDATMAQAFAQAMAGLSEQAGSVVRNGQRDWLNVTRTICSDSNLRGAGALASRRVACLQTMYDQRLEVLEQNRLVNGYRFYTADTYGAFPNGDPQFKYGLKVSSGLRIDGATPFALAFNDAMGAWSLAHAGRYTDFAGNDIDDRQDDTDDSAVMRIVSHNGMRLSVRLELAHYGQGAAHASFSFGMQHFLFAEARALEPRDLFAGKRWQALLAQQIAHRAGADIRNGEVDYEASFMTGLADKTQQWLFTPAGLTVQFEPGEVTPNGTPAIVVPWTALDAVLTDEAQAIGAWD